jgi:hypothetical protein
VGNEGGGAEEEDREGLIPKPRTFDPRLHHHSLTARTSPRIRRRPPP